MDLLQSYSSNDSDEEEEPVKDDTSQGGNTDYFNLESSDLDSDSCGHGTKTILDACELIERSKILNEETYGPAKPQEFPRLENECSPRFESGKRASLFKRPFSAHAFSKKQKVTMCDSEKELSEVESMRTSSFGKSLPKYTTSLHTEAGEDFLGEKHSCTISGGEIFHTSEKISYYLSRDVNCKIPKCKTSHSLHKSCITSLDWCVERYSHLLMSGSMDSTVKVWDMLLAKTVAEISADGPIKSSKWSVCGTKIIYGGFGKTANIIDLNTGQKIFSCSLEDYVSSLAVHPEMDNVFLVGTKNNIFAFDLKDSESIPIKRYSSNCQQVLDIAFFDGGTEFVCSTEIVSHDCADRTLMVWDFGTAALMSNQIYAECYTCPCVRVEPGGSHFIAQSNGDYIVMFNTKRPYKRRNRRYCGHKVAGYSIGCDFSPDGKYIVSGDSEGELYIYYNEPCSLAKQLVVKQGVATVQVKWHPVLYSTLATASLDGSVQIWQ